MRIILLLVISSFLAVACNRPMPQLPITQTPLAGLPQVVETASPGRLLSPTLTGMPITKIPQTTVTFTTTPTSSPTPWFTRTPNSTSTPYPTPVWCPVESPPSASLGKLRLVYASHGNLWLSEEGKPAIQLTQSRDIGQVSISDDGQIIVFTRKLDKNHAELWAINIDGSRERRLINADELTQLDGSKDALGVLPIRLQWEPGTHHFIFNTYPIYDGIWIFEPSIYWLVNLDTDAVSPAPYHGGYIAYSPDGKRVVIFSINGLSLSNIDGSGIRENILPGYHGIGEGESYYHPQPYWAPDSASLLVALPDQVDIYNNKGTVTIWRIPVDGALEIVGQWNAFAPSVQISPDQTYMAYWRWPKPAKNLRELHLTRLEGNTSDNGSDTIYMNGDLISDPVWSPDSQYFTFHIGDPEKNIQQYLGHICQRPQLIFENTNGANAIWIDASRYLLEISVLDSPDQWEIHLGKIGQEQLEELGMVTSYDWTILP
jgi:hypothetical protein